MAAESQTPTVGARLAIQSIAAEITRLPRTSWLVVGLIELGASVVGRLPQAIAAILLSLVLVALAEIYLTRVLLGTTSERPAELARAVIARLKDVLGFELLEGLAAGLVAFPVVLVLIAALYHPSVSQGQSATFPSAWLFIGSLDILAAPLFGRWLCALPLIVDRRLGSRAAMRISWTAVRGSTIRCAGLWLLTELPVLITLAAPSSVELPVAFLDSFVVALLQTALSVAVYRQLFVSIRRSYQITDAGRQQFDTEAAILLDEGYRIASTVDVDDIREISWSR